MWSCLLTLPAYPELARHAAMAVARYSRLDKVARGDNIDAIVALAMAVEGAEPVRIVG